MSPGNYYHIYHHANGKENLFVEDRNYIFFMEKFLKYPFAFIKVHAYCLMPNHFHFLISVKDYEDVRFLKDFKLFKNLPEEKLQPLIEKKISKSFANLFSSYAQSFNKLYKRKGSLFIPNMKAKLVSGSSDICKVVHYIHTNPVHHGFVKEMNLWKYSSYNAYLSEEKTLLSKTEIIEIFGSLEYFKEYHEQPIELKIDLDR